MKGKRKHEYYLINLKNTTFCLNYLQHFYLGKFGYCLMKHIVTILSKRNAHKADKDIEKRSWIQSEAAMFASVNRTGTLRYMNVMYIFKIKPKLHYVIYGRLKPLKADRDLSSSKQLFKRGL